MTFALVAAAILDPPLIMILPFALLLLAIAVMPMVHVHWWERHYPKVALALGAVTIVYYVVVVRNPERMLHVAHEYVSFIALIGSLFVVSGGIHIDVKGEAKPLVNCLFLFTGTLLSNLIGTTGASMLLIRPWIRMNKYRITAFHIVFFIFIVSNAGGCLTPVGDPPLFLGYLKGVPFWWVFQHCWRAWAIVVAGLIGTFFVLDWRNFLRAPRIIREEETRQEIWKVEGCRNLLFLAVILTAVFIKQPAGLGEGLMFAAGLASWFATPERIHRANLFTFGSLREVAWLFLGIFATMTPVVDYLEVHATALGLNSEMEYYWFTGLLSGMLDNAPTYLTFLAAAVGRQHLSLNERDDVLSFIAHHDYQLIAISLGAVFFGAMTYIGNGPNFMVRSISQQSKVETPGFFAYVLKYAVPILLPLLGLISLLFFSPWRVF